MTVHTHGYGGYSRGCRCDTCRSAKAERMRMVRAAARRVAQSRSDVIFKYPNSRVGAVRHVASGVRHGTRYAYDERGCRCMPCTDAARLWKASPNGATRKDAA